MGLSARELLRTPLCHQVAPLCLRVSRFLLGRATRSCEGPWVIPPDFRCPPPWRPFSLRHVGTLRARAWPLESDLSNYVTECGAMSHTAVRQKPLWQLDEPRHVPVRAARRGVQTLVPAPAPAPGRRLSALAAPG